MTYNLTPMQMSWLKMIKNTPPDRVQKKRLIHPKSGAMCVLGAMCDLYREKHPDSCWWDREGRFHLRVWVRRVSRKGKDMSFVSKQLFTYVPPFDVFDWMQVPEFISWEGQRVPISYLQDRTDLTNPEIAAHLAKILSDWNTQHNINGLVKEYV